MSDDPDIVRNLGGNVPLQPAEEQLQQGSRSAVEQVRTAPPLQAGAHEAGSARFAIVIGYRGQERTTELRLPQNMISQLAFEAQFRDMSLGELTGALIAATMEKGLFQLILDTAKEQQTLVLKEIRVFPET
jgi:hypothetical protein